MGGRNVRAALGVLLVVPWLWPFTPGPSASVGPLFAAWACLLLTVPLLAACDDPVGVLRDELPTSWFVAASVSAAIGLAQWFGVAPTTPWVSHANLAEAYGNLRQRNQFASLMSLGLVAAVWSPAGPRALRYLLVALIATASVASSSRTGLLQLVTIAALAAAWPGARRERLVTCAVAVIAYAVAALVLPRALLELRGVDAATAFGRAFAELGCSSRKVLWGNVLQLIAERPWTGWGLGELDYAHYATLYPGARFCDILDNAHNLPLHLAVELGVPVALLVTGAIALGVWRGRPWREVDAARQLAWCALLLVALHSLLEYPLWYGPFQLTTLFAGVLLWRGRRQSLLAWRLAAVAVVAGLGALGYAAFEYARVSQAYKLPPDRWAAFRDDPIRAAGRVVVFRAQLGFAELSITDVDERTAARVHELALRMLHYSPEPMVIEKLVASARLLGRREEAEWHLVRFKAAFPEQYEAWRTQGGAAAAGDHPPILAAR